MSLVTQVITIVLADLILMSPYLVYRLWMWWRERQREPNVWVEFV